VRYVLYHANCPDGFGAAWAAWTKYHDNAEYIPVSYGQEPPAMQPGSDVLIVDFSYPRETLLRLADVHMLHVEDHHLTAQADLEGLDFCHFDMDKSGAVLAWEYLFPDELVPDLLRYVQDRDLWRWAMPSSREVSAWISSHPFEFRRWEEHYCNLEQFPEQVIAEGAAILRAKNQAVETMCTRVIWVGFGHEAWGIPAVNASVHFSEVGERLCELYPDQPFAAYYFDRDDGRRQWGLRSRNGFDVSTIAKLYGGGGHAAAAGFTTDQHNWSKEAERRVVNLTSVREAMKHGNG